MLPLNSIIKNAFDKFDQDFQTAILPIRHQELVGEGRRGLPS